MDNVAQICSEIFLKVAQFSTGINSAVQLLLGHTKLESTVRYLGIEVEDALELSEQTEI